MIFDSQNCQTIYLKSLKHKKKMMNHGHYSGTPCCINIILLAKINIMHSDAVTQIRKLLALQ